MPHHLFTYGTLRPHHAPPGIAPVVDRLVSVGPGTLRARLYDLGPYPAVVLDPNAPTLVQGHVYRLPAGPEILAALDAYEDFRPADPAGSLYLREAANVTLTGGATLPCWVYTWNRPLPRTEVPAP